MFLLTLITPVRYHGNPGVYSIPAESDNGETSSVLFIVDTCQKLILTICDKSIKILLQNSYYNFIYNLFNSYCSDNYL